MGGIAHGVVEAALTHVAGVAVDGVAIRGVDAAEVHHKERNGVGLVPDGDQIKTLKTLATAGVLRQLP